MNTTKRIVAGLTLVGSLFCVALLGLIFEPAAQAGPIPFTQSQFPVWYASLAAPVSLTNSTTETILYQVAVPPNVMGNSGFMQIQAIADGDAGSTNKILTYYLGPAAFASATPLCTNTYKTSTATPIQTTVQPYFGGYSNLVFSTLYTNSLAGALKQTISVGSNTNGLFLTITGQTGDTHGTYMTLGGVQIEALSQ